MSKMVLEAVLADIEVRKVNTKRGEKTIYELIMTEGPKITSWEEPLAKEAWAMKGLTAQYEVEVSTNGDFTNYTLRGVNAPQSALVDGLREAFDKGMAARVAKPMEAAATWNPGTSASEATVTMTGPTMPTVPVERTDREMSIHRQVAAKVAATISSTPNEFWHNIDDLYNYFQTGFNPLAQAGAGESEKQYSEPAFTEPTPDDDIPF